MSTKMSETRRFAHGLRKSTISSSGGDSKETASTRGSIIPATFETESNAIVPVDYEEFLEINSQKISKDALKDLLLFPDNDFEVIEETASRRTEISTVPTDAHLQASSLMVQKCIDAYKRNWNVVKKKYDEYSGDYYSLPSHKHELKLDKQIFEIDEEPTDDLDSTNRQLNYSGNISQVLTYKGWLYKSIQYSIAGNSSTRMEFKRRYFHLIEFSDHSQILNFYKDEKTNKTPKGAIYLDSCVAVVMNTRTRKHGFEIRMADNTCYHLAADNDIEAQKWVDIINTSLQRYQDDVTNRHDKLLAANASDQKTNNSGDSPNHNKTSDDVVSVTSQTKHNSMHPQLMKYAKETDHKNAVARKENRINIFKLFPDFHHQQQQKEKKGGKVKAPTIQIDNNKHQRVMIACKSLNFSLRGVVQDGCEEPITNVEPFFVTLALYDACEGRKISADLHIDLNHAIVRKMIPEKIQPPSALSSTTKDVDSNRIGEAQINQLVDIQWIAHPKQGIFTVTKPHSEIYLVARIEKVLQGSIKSCVQPYLRCDSDMSKTALKVLKHVKPVCQRLGHYRMPFAWTARPLFTTNGATDHHHISPSFPFVYKHESNKISDDELLKYLADFKKLDKNNKLEYVDCQFNVSMDTVPTDLPNILTSSLTPVKPYQHGGGNDMTSHSHITSPDAIFEVDEFPPPQLASLQYANCEYINHCYIYPKQLDYDGQKSFAKARNLLVVAEFRDTDDQPTSGLRSFYKRPGPPAGNGPFTSKVSTSVLHHHDHPQFYDEWKLQLPTQLHHGHHILFSFYHVMVDINAKKKDSTYLEVGYAWLPLLTKDGHVTSGLRHLPISINLPAKYLTTDEQMFITSSGAKHSTEVRWVDGGKALFHVDISLKSTIYTSQTHLHNFFNACQRFQCNTINDQDLTRHIKGLLAIEDTEMIRFLPMIIDQLLYLMTCEKFSTDAQNRCMHSLVHIVTKCHKNDHQLLLKQYIQYMFVTAPWKDYQSKTIHEEVIQAMSAILRPNTSDFLTPNLLLKHSSFFLEIVIKSIAQHLISTQKIELPRSKRFPISFNHVVSKLIEIMSADIVKKWQGYIIETFNANESLANFLKESFTYLDRGFVFKQINKYLSHFSQNDSKVLFELKFNFIRIICSHEHFIQLNLPLACRSKSQYSYSMDEQFCRNHFLVGLLLKHLSSALHSIPDIRWNAIQTFRDILAKHIFDDRYVTNEEKQRISSLYLPLLHIIMDNVAMLQPPTSSNDQMEHVGGNTNKKIPSTTMTSAATGDHHLFPPSTSSSSVINQGSLRIKKPDINIMNAIANPTSLNTRGARASIALIAASSNYQQDVTSSNEKLDKAYATTASITTSSLSDNEQLCDVTETRSLLLCFLQIVENLPTEAIHGFWKDSTSKEISQFFDVLEMCLHHFRYTGKKDLFNKYKNLQFPSSLNKLIGSDVGGKSKTMPGRVRMSMMSQSYNKNISTLAEAYVSKATMTDEEMEKCENLASNLSTQIGLIILDCTAEYTRYFKKQLKEGNDKKLMKRIIHLLLMFLQIGQSERTLKHVFAALRLVLAKFPNILFRGPHNICASFIYHTLRCCDSYLHSTRNEACALLYLLMRKNYENGHVRNFLRSHLQMIKAVSQLISEEIGIESSRFQSSLSDINTFAHTDKGMQRTSFPSDVKNLMKKIRIVLQSTAAMREHDGNPEMMVDLQYRLASSYSATPELRKTWLESMARLHVKHENFSEAAMCYLHIAALIAEHLRKKNILQKGTSSAFRTISPNIEKEESTSVKEDVAAGLDDDTYNEEIFVDILLECGELFEKAERYEILAQVFKMIIPYYERQRDYSELAQIYGRLQNGYKKVVEVTRNGKRLLGTYFRVSFYGSLFGEEDGKEYIYKEPKLTQLSEISDRLKTMYGEKFGHENFSLIQESGKVNRKTLDENMAYAQVTFVQPYFDDQEIQHKLTYFERQHNVRNFCFETPFTPSGKARGDIDQQWKRKTICTTSHTFPYIKKRISISSMRSFELKPIEVAVEEMKNKCQELEELVTADRIDIKKLQLRLQGSVNCQVNAGPLAYAKVFLDENKCDQNAEQNVNDLRNIFRKFIDLCNKALQINSEMILGNQQAYHASLQQSFNVLVEELQIIMNETLIIMDDDTMSVTTTGNDSVFSLSIGGISQHATTKVIGGTTQDSSIA